MSPRRHHHRAAPDWLPLVAVATLAATTLLCVALGSLFLP